MLMLGICLLTYNCSFVFPSSPTEVSIDSFSIELAAYDPEKPISFDSVDVTDTPFLEEIFFNSGAIRNKYGHIPLRKVPSFGGAAYARQEQFVSAVANLVITSDKDIYFTDSLIEAGTNLLHRCSFNRGVTGLNSWNTGDDFVEWVKRGEELEPFTMRISTPLKSPIDQHFTFTFTHIDGEMVSATSPRVVAR